MVRKQVNKRRVFIVILGILTVFAIHLVLRGDTVIQDSSISKESDTVTADFSCNDNKSIKAEFINKENASVNLTLSDGVKLNLSHVVSADGGRYSNSDESIIFWSVGNTATLQEDNVTTYDNCVTSS